MPGTQEQQAGQDICRMAFSFLKKIFARDEGRHALSPLYNAVVAEARNPVWYLEGKLPEAAGAYRVVIERWSESYYAVESSFGLATVLEEQEELVEALKILEDLKGIYPKEDILTRKTEQVRERIEKKKKAI